MFEKRVCDMCKQPKHVSEFKTNRWNGMMVCLSCRAIINAERAVAKAAQKEQERLEAERAKTVRQIRTDRVNPVMEPLHPYTILYARKSLKSIKHHFDKQ